MRDAMDFPVRLERCGDGFAAHGPGFYVWDDDARALLEAACELAGAVRSRAPGAAVPFQLRGAALRSRRGSPSRRTRPSRHEGGSARARGGADDAWFHATVHLECHREPTHVDPTPEQLDLRQHRVDEGLAAEARVHGHHEDLIEIAQHRFDGRRPVSTDSAPRTRAPPPRGSARACGAGADTPRPVRRSSQRPPARSRRRTSRARRSSGARRAAARSSASRPRRRPDRS